jgi:Ni,Fe-hydrogenase III large subunit
VERNDLSDRRFDVLLERLDRIGDELARLNRRAENDDAMVRLTREIAALSESLQAIAYAALGQSSPQIRRRRAG